MSWWIYLGLAATLAGLAWLAVWAASAFWVHLISARWNAMCAPEEPRKRR